MITNESVTSNNITLIRRRTEALCQTPHGLLAYSRGSIGLIDEDTCEFSRLLDIPCPGAKFKFNRLRLLERLFRINPRCGAIFDGRTFVSIKGRLLEVDLITGSFKVSCVYRETMSHPLSLVPIEDVAGFDDALVFGDYYGNIKRDEVCVYSLRKGKAKWDVAYSFSPGSVCHIHNLIPDRDNECVYILTGDEDAESAIWIATENFTRVKPLLRGSQNYRSCVGIANRTGLIYATDSPTSSNYIMRVSKPYDSHIAPERIVPLRGSVIYGATDGSDFYFSTTVEPDSRIKGWRYLITRRLGAGVADRSVDVCRLDASGLKVLATFQKDMWPITLFQFGTAAPVIGLRGVYINCNSVKKYDGCLLRIDQR